MMRNVYKSRFRLENSVTQGSIINHCVAEKYSCSIWGVIITPRCDLAHTGKVTHVHYLPVIPFEEWYKVDGIHYLWSKTLESNRKKIQDFCKEHGFPVINLGEKQLRALCESVSNQQDKDKFRSYINSFYKTENTNPRDYQPSENEKNRLIENLCKGEIPAFFLIEDWNNNNHYMVVLLRDLKRLQYSIATGMASGIEEMTIEDTWKNDLEYSVSKDQLYKIEAEILSPYIEQLMERFSYNFCRIGVADMKDNIKDELQKILNV